MLSIAKSNQVIVENTYSKPQETLEFKMNKQNESFSFDVTVKVNEKWMMENKFRSKHYRSQYSPHQQRTRKSSTKTTTKRTCLEMTALVASITN